MKVKYVGAMPDGFVEDRTIGITHVFKKNVPINVSDSFGELLIKESVWKKSIGEKAKEGGK